jgi:protein involved in polysaccharide export with SLBB domain
LNDSLDVVSDPSFVLMPFDEVIVRRSPIYNVQEKVLISGEILFPGTYVLPSKHITLSQLVEMGGGCTSDAYLQSAKLLRKKSEEERKLEKKALKAALELATNKEDSLAIIKQQDEEEEGKYSIAIDLAEAMEKPGSDADILLQEGDQLIIPRRIDVVRVSGEIMVPNAISYREGKSVKYYINQAGGYTSDAKKSKIYVVHANGEVEKVKKRSRSIYPGSEIVVSAKKKRDGGMSAAQLVSLGSATTSLATVVLALMNVLK